MKILETQSAVLSNHDVLTHLTSLRSKPRTTPKKSQNFETVIKELTDYLHPPLPLPATPTTRTLLTNLQPYALTKTELLVICNLRPTELGLLDCVVEECDLRFSEEEQVGICAVVGGGVGVGEGDGDGDGDGDGVGVNGGEGEDMGSSQETVR